MVVIDSPLISLFINALQWDVLTEDYVCILFMHSSLDTLKEIGATTTTTTATTTTATTTTPLSLSSLLFVKT